MRIDILTCLPGLLQGPFDHSIVKRAQERGKVEIHIHDIREFSTDKHHKTDDYAFGGGAGMVMTIQPIADCIDHLKAEREYDEFIFMSPDGQPFLQKHANEMASFTNIIILCGHYKGVDQRLRDLYITREISLGDFVLSGGEIAAVAVTDAIVRLIPGVLSDETSALTDSFQDGMLAAPVYTRPADYKGHKVPEVLRSGNPKLIDQWRFEKSEELTKSKRPDLLSDE